MTLLPDLVFFEMGYIIDFYSELVQMEILSLPPALRARYFVLADRMAHYGCNLGPPHTATMGDGLYELRLKAKDGIARVFYCTLLGKRIVMLHSFVKKTQKTPLHQLRIAQVRMREVKHEDI